MGLSSTRRSCGEHRGAVAARSSDGCGGPPAVAARRGCVRPDWHAVADRCPGPSLPHRGARARAVRRAGGAASRCSDGRGAVLPPAVGPAGPSPSGWQRRARAAADRPAGGGCFQRPAGPTGHARGGVGGPGRRRRRGPALPASGLDRTAYPYCVPAAGATGRPQGPQYRARNGRRPSSAGGSERAGDRPRGDGGSTTGERASPPPLGAAQGGLRGVATASRAGFAVPHLVGGVRDDLPAHRSSRAAAVRCSALPGATHSRSPRSLE